MKVNILLLSLTVLFLVASCTTKEVGKQVTYVIEEKQPIVFVVEHNSPVTWTQNTMKERNDLNTIRAIREDNDEQELFEKQTKLKNLRRSYDGEVIFGFDGDLDNPYFEEVN